MNSFFLIFSFLFLTQVCNSQDVIFRNPENRIVYDFLDTSVNVDHRSVNVNIGPDHKQSQNTIFFNKLFRFNYAQIQSFKIKGVFLQQFIIDYSDFKERTLTIDSTNFDTLFITNTTFKDTLIFRNVYIRDFKFIFNVFPKYLLFDNCTIENLDMQQSNMIGIMSFNNCQLGNVSFWHAGFHHSFSLSGNTINGHLNLDDAFFVNKVNLSSLKIGPSAKLSFRVARLPDTLDLSNNSFVPDTLNLTGFGDLNSTKVCNIMIHGSDISRIRLDYSYFKLIFPDSLNVDERANIYERLLENLRRYSYQQSYKLLDIEYKRFQAKQGTFGFLWWIPDLWWEYGYDRGRIFKIVFWSILFLTIINYTLLNHMVSKVYPIRNIPAYYRTFSWKRLWFSLIYTCIIFFSLSIKVDRIKFQNVLGSLYLMIVYTFGIVCLAYMANYLIQR